LEATELEEVQPVESSPHRSGVDSKAASRHDEATSGAGPELRRLNTTPRQKAKDTAVKRFWRRQISVSVPHEDCRDHLALERTFLGYVRTSTALVMIGITVAQLFRLQSNPSPGGKVGFHVTGTPLAGLFICLAILVAVSGGWRFWRLQNALVRGKIRAAGWEVTLVGVSTIVVSLDHGS
jgi:uncharacterized membrane protein YidH (DUF202 family)